MSDTLRLVQARVLAGDYRVSRHGFRELAADDILVDDVVVGIADAVLIEDYPDAYKGPSILVMQHDPEGRSIHVVWGIPSGGGTHAVLVTAYRPTPELWSADLMTRKQP